MIQLHRDRMAVDPSFLDPGRHARLMELFGAARAGRLKDKATSKRLFASDRWKAAKPQLQKETSGKCAFCETPTAAVYYGDVEHFRPKADYWWLAYCYDNYLFSCRVCNGKKSDKHLKASSAMPAPAVANLSDAQVLQLALTSSPAPGDAVALATLTTALAAEGALLPNPYEVNPEPIFTWVADPVLREVRMAANPAHPASAGAMRAAEEVLDLNRDELRTLRWKTYEQLERLRGIAQIAGEPIRSDVVALLTTMADSSMPYAAMVRYFAKSQWRLIP
jgi:uncharacterized protein (TIGR02646 family)